jgi:hypothetical protein
MDKDEILAYVRKTPANTNVNVLGSMLESVKGEGGTVHTFTEIEVHRRSAILIEGKENDIQPWDKFIINFSYDGSSLEGYFIPVEGKLYLIASSGKQFIQLDYDDIEGVGKVLFLGESSAFPGGFKPSGTINITKNGVTDVYSYAQANVDIDTFEPSGTRTIDSPGTYDVYNYETADVLLPTEYFNGTITVSNGAATIRFSKHPTSYTNYGEFNGLITLNNQQYTFWIKTVRANTHYKAISDGLNISLNLIDEELSGIDLNNIPLSDGDYSCIVTDIPGIKYYTEPLTITSNGYYNVYGKSIVYVNIQ